MSVYARSVFARSGADGSGADETRLCRKGAAWPWQLVIFAAFVSLIVFLFWIVGGPALWVSHRLEVLLTLGGIAFWRWSWFGLQNLRAIVYRYWTFPRLRRKAQRALAEFGPVPEITVLGTTYHEKPWIT